MSDFTGLVSFLKEDIAFELEYRDKLIRNSLEEADKVGDPFLGKGFRIQQRQQIQVLRARIERLENM